MAAKQLGGAVVHIKGIIASIRAALRARPKRGRLARMTAAPLHLAFRGQSYDIVPLTLTDLATLQEFLRDLIYRQARGLIERIREAGGPEEHVALTWNEAREAARNPLRTDFVTDPEALIERIFLCLRHHQPAITRETVREMADDPALFAEFDAALRELHGLDNTLKNSLRPIHPTPMNRPGQASSAASPSATDGLPNRSEA